MTGGDGQREEFLNAYRAWKAATDAYQDKMVRAISGESVEWEQTMREVKELANLHADFLEKSRPFVSWKRA